MSCGGFLVSLEARKTPTSHSQAHKISNIDAASFGGVRHEQMETSLSGFSWAFFYLPQHLAWARNSRTRRSIAPPLGPKEMQEERAKVQMAEKRYEAAIQSYQDLLKADPKNAIFMNMIGIAYLDLSNYDQAKKYFARASKADKKYSSAVNNLGMVYYHQKEFPPGDPRISKSGRHRSEPGGDSFQPGICLLQFEQVSRSRRRISKSAGN